MWIGHLHTLFCKRSAQIFCPFLIKCLVSLLNRTSLFYIKFLCKNVCIANIFSFTYLVFSFFNSFLQITKVLHFNKVYFIFFFFLGAHACWFVCRKSLFTPRFQKNLLHFLLYLLRLYLVLLKLFVFGMR